MMNIIKWLIVVCLTMPVLTSAVLIDIINYSKDNVLVSSNNAITESSFGRTYEPIVYPAEDIPAHHPQNDPSKPAVPAKKTRPTTYMVEIKRPSDFFYFSTNRGIYYVDKVQDRLVVWRQSQYGSKDLEQRKQLAVYNDAQKIQKILITISQSFDPSVEGKL